MQNVHKIDWTHLNTAVKGGLVEDLYSTKYKLLYHLKSDESRQKFIFILNSVGHSESNKFV